MLRENIDIDQLFRNTLGEYEKTPPGSVWVNIEVRLNRYQWNRRLFMLKAVGIAAAVVLAFLAGWWMINAADKDMIRQNSMADQGTFKKNTAPSENIITPYTPKINTNKAALVHSKINSATHSKVASLATFAANTSFITKEGRLTSQKIGELELFDTEKDFPDNLRQNINMVKKITEWITSSMQNDSISAAKTDPNALAKEPAGRSAPDKFISIATLSPVKNVSGQWSIKAEFAPVFNSQSQNNGQRTFIVSNSSQNYAPQKTISENTFSAGIVAGYRVGKRFSLKSGMVYNNIRQTTKNVNFIVVNPLYNSTGNIMVAPTPAGQVTLNNRGNTRIGAILSSNDKFDNSVNYSGENVLKQDIQFIEIPVQATYKLIDNKLGIGLTGGISTNILVGNKAVLSGNGDGTSNGETSNLRNVVYSGEVGLEIGYEISNRITLTVEPRLKHFISSISASKSVDYKPNQVEIATGLTYWFN